MTDPAIPRSLAAFWEGQFFKDMARLRVREPNTITRVTEYVPEIVAFVEKIIRNGYAYESEGSVYFDTKAFDNADGHDYAKLEPWSKGNRELLEDGEGTNASLTAISIYHSYSTQVLCQKKLAVGRLLTLLFGKPPNLENLHGLHPGVQVDRGGI